MAEPTRSSATRIESRLEFEMLLSDLSAKFINLSPHEVNGEIEDALRKVCELLDIDLAALWQWSLADPGVITATHVYHAQEDLQLPEKLSEEHFPWCRQQMLDGRVVAVSSLQELPAEAAVDGESCRLFGIRSNLTLPLSVGGAPSIGALGFNTIRAEHDWPDEVVKRLQLVAEVFGNALERKRGEETLRASEARQAAGAELAGLAFYEVNFGEGTMYFDDRTRDLCGVPPEREQGLQVLEFWMEHLHPDDRQRVVHLRDQLHDGPLPRISLEYRYLHPASGEKWIQHLAGVAARDAGGRAVATYGVLRDITERKRVEDELRDLSRRLIRAHEEERALLARELHDDVTQRLAVLAIEVGGAERAAPDGPQASSMRSVREGLVRLSEDVHSLAYQLHPSVLEELGLAEALRAECERRGHRGRVAFSVDLDPLPAVVGKDVALCLFRITQEALNNVVRHANAQAASVQLRKMDDGLLLAIRDDGVGFDPTSPGSGGSLGLVSMRERVRLMNGTLDIESAPGRGTVVVAWVPAEGESR